MWCIILLDCWILNHPCILGMNPTWSSCVILLMYCYIWFFNILFMSSTSMFIRNIVLRFFFVCDVLVWFSYKGNVDLIKWVREHCLFNYLEEIEKDRYHIFFEYLLKFITKATLNFLVGEIFDYCFNFLASDQFT